MRVGGKMHDRQSRTNTSDLYNSIGRQERETVLTVRVLESQSSAVANSGELKHEWSGVELS
jgi:hypothetical protein